MKKDKQRPVLTHKMHWELVQELGKVKDTRTKTSIFSRLMDAYAFAACLGFELKERLPLPDGDKEDIQWPQVERERDDSLINLIAIAESRSLSILEENTDVDPIQIFEEYAHGGFNKITAWRKDQPTDDLFNAIIEGLINSKVLKREEKEETPIIFEKD